MLLWLFAAVSLCALLIGVFALMRANRVHAAMRRAIAALPDNPVNPQVVLGTREVTLPDVQGPLSRVAVVRFDAFADVSGKLSSSAAVLDQHGNGLVITTMNGRDSTRNYLKEVKRGAGTAALSPEESDAVGRAMGSRKRVP